MQPSVPFAAAGPASDLLDTLAAMRVERQVGVRLFHTTRVDSRMTSTTFHYRIQVTLVDRPETGVRTGWLRCTTCGNLVGLCIQSAERTRARKRRDLVVLVLSLVAGAGLVAYVLSLPDEGVPDGLTTVLAILGVVLFIVLVVAGHLLLTEQGVGIARKRANGPHRTQPYGAEGTVHLLSKRENTPAPFIDDEF
jgi:hypothetical protein